MTSDESAARFQPETMSAHGAATDYVPADLDASDWSQLEPLLQGLLDRPVESASDFETWLVDRSELDAAYSEARATLYIRMSCHTDDKAANDAYTKFIDEIPPRHKPLDFRLDRRHVELAERFPLDADRYHVVNRDVRREVELFRDQNVPIETRLAKLSQKYDQIAGAMTVEFDDAERTLPQMARYLQKSDRKVRESAWRAIASRRLKDRDAIDGLYDEMIRYRHQIAINAGYDNYRDYKHAEFCRFDYSPRDCFEFHAAVEAHCVPFNHRIQARRQQRLKVDPLRPWDLQVDELGRAPLAPFADGQDLIEKSRRVFDRLSPDLGAMFAELGDNETPGGCLDLNSRKGKAPGGYQYMRDRSRQPFIFMNAAGLHRDVETMVHEAGHAFHSQLCRGEPLIDYRHAPIEFAEVASMTMELLTMPYWDEFYPDPADANRARREQLESSIGLLPWIATIDAFQHWI
ncbi:MAG: M3 family oligoendopeptidase, partial [Phycisphaerales bacterium]|nr:M3 family oligoendopeptidase [Phycisphaerales bacterium]